MHWANVAITLLSIPLLFPSLLPAMTSILSMKTIVGIHFTLVFILLFILVLVFELVFVLVLLDWASPSTSIDIPPPPLTWDWLEPSALDTLGALCEIGAPLLTACENNILIRCSDSPDIDPINSGAETRKYGTFNSPAMALAMEVLPHPVGPWNKIVHVGWIFIFS